MNHKISFFIALNALVAILSLMSASTWAIDWASVPAREITLFYPGQTSWEWLLTEHKGAALIKAGQDCALCHAGKQNEMGQKIIEGQLLEPSPSAGKPGAIELEVKTAHDAENLYIRLEWPAEASPADKAYPDFESMAAVILDDGQVPEIARAGCWGACHDDMDGMASAVPNQAIDKYLVKSRTKMTRKGGADNIKSPEQLRKLLAQGFYAEIWQARLNRGQAASVLDGYILETRHHHDSAQVFADAAFAGGTRTVVFGRKLALNDPTYKIIEPGKTYTIGFAIHEGYVKGRRHYVSFKNTLRLDEGAADLIARKH